MNPPASNKPRRWTPRNVGVVLCVAGVLAAYLMRRGPSELPTGSDATDVNTANVGPANVDTATKGDSIKRSDDPAGQIIKLTMPAELHEMHQSVLDNDDPRLEPWRDVSISVFDNEELPARLRIRGQSSTKFPRKSFHLDLLNKREVWQGNKMKRLYLLNLAFDPYGFEMRYAYDCLGALGLFPSRNTLARLQINGTDQGLYLAVERPRNGIRKAHDDVVAVFRMSKARYELRWAKEGLSSPRRILRRLEEAIALPDEQERASELSQYLDVQGFSQWMACCSILENGDSTGELFLYEQRSGDQRLGRLAVMGWDFDDLGRESSRPANIIQHPLTWACESKLEYCILTTPPLFRGFRSTLKTLLNSKFSEANIQQDLGRVAEHLADLDPSIQAKRERRIDAFEDRLLKRRETLLKELAK